MSDLPLKRGAGAAVPSKLYLVFLVGEERFALPATEIAEVLPRLPLKPIAQAPHWVAGVFGHRGRVVPVIDVGALMFGQPALERTSTRLVLVHYRADPARPDLLLGLVLQQATQTLRCNPEEFRPYGLSNRATPYLGPVREDALGMLQWVGVQDLLDDVARQLLFAPQLSQLLAEGDTP
ncbi:MAG: chemotaxis protein CheW [Pseudomonas sp.]|uniref:chemotaxis protein CheW n=1 Tax=Pseudomonas abieticivorans TaxID=2931382 RepID=UPI0020C06A32|nr:chemotaxis protein CheW [Pseudomonas sp. PIA16]MDE1166039.1 chemotaxis protein CheW [Pseudomonas sp.]